MEWFVPIAVAVIGGPIMWLLHRLDRHNTEQHNTNLDTLRRIDSKVDDVNGKLTRHIEWHLDRSERFDADSDN